MSLLIVGLDATIVNIALPAIQHSFHARCRAASGPWTHTPWYWPGLLMLAGSTADRLGRRLIFRTGLVVFSIGSLLCALAPSLEAASSRVASCKASAGAMPHPVAMSRSSATWFEDPRERAQALGRVRRDVRISHGPGAVLAGSSSTRSRGGRSSW